MIQYILKAFCKGYGYKVIKTPKKLGTFSIGKVSNILSPLTKNVFLSDKKYLMTSMQEAKVFTNKSRVHARKYKKESNDCDDFSFALHSYWSENLDPYCFGIAWSKSHAFNIMVDNKKQIWIIEPQTNKWLTLQQVKKTKKYYPLTLILI